MNRSEYSSARSRRDPRRAQRMLRSRLIFVLWVVFLLLISAAITAIIDRGDAHEEPQDNPQTVSEIGVLAPLPFEHSTLTVESIVHAFGPVQQTGAYTVNTMDYSRIALQERGQVTTSYFADAAFLGDSITQGFTEYHIELSGALICGYVGISPNSVVNRTAVKHSERGEEVILDVLAERQPAKLYVLLGANQLVAQGNDDNYIAYYGQMLNLLQEALPNTAIFVQSLTPVTNTATERQPGLDNERFRALNQRLAQMAYEKGCYFLDLYSAFAVEDGTLNPSYAQPDGLHFTVSGYEHWIDYLCRHVPYRSDNPWLTGSPYAETTPVVVEQAGEESTE